MQIRIKAVFVEFGNVHISRGEVIDLPSKLADELIASGDAVTVPKAEHALVPHIPDHAHGGRVRIARSADADAGTPVPASPAPKPKQRKGKK